MKFRSKFAITMAVVGVLFVGIAVQSEADIVVPQTAPGSSDDPLVTKSYVDEQIRKLTGAAVNNSTSPSGLTKDDVQKLINEEVAKAKQEWQSQIQQASDTKPVSNDSTNDMSSGKDTAVTTLKLEAGETLYGGAGAEFIVRTGKVIAFTTDANGIADVTSGKDIPGNASIDLNHLLIFPREGRGIKPDPKQASEIYVVIKGNYLLHKADGTEVAP